MAINSNGSPAFTTPLRTSSPATRSTGSGSPVNADSSSTAADSKRPSTATTSPAPTTRRSPVPTSSTSISTMLSPTPATGSARRPLHEQAQIPPRTRLGACLKQLAAGKHDGDHRAGEQFVDRDRTGQRQQRDHVDGRLTTPKRIDHGPGREAQTQHSRRSPQRGRHRLVARQPRHDTAEQQHRRRHEQRKNPIPKQPGHSLIFAVPVRFVRRA